MATRALWQVGVLLLGAFAASSACLDTAYADAHASFFCQQGSQSVVVDPGQQPSYLQQGYQCTSITHQEAFVCAKDGDQITVFGGTALSTYLSLGFNCRHQ